MAGSGKRAASWPETQGERGGPLSLYRFIRPILFHLNPEAAHRATLRLIGAAGATAPGRLLLRAAFAPTSPGRPIELMGLTFRNSLGLAAGYDKDAVAVDGLASLGFGHIEVGTVTPEPQPGNPRPRLFRLIEDEALVNRLGFPSDGGGAVRKRLASLRTKEVVVGVSLGKGAQTAIEEAVQDYLSLLDLFYDVADYLVVNVSSPNTVGLRRLQARDHLESLLTRLVQHRRGLPGATRPLLVKLSPDLEAGEVEDALAAVRTAGAEGIIASNTSLGRTGLKSSLAREVGGLSGQPLFEGTLRTVRRLVSALGGTLPVVACGGVSEPDQYRALLDAGAGLVQVYTGLVYCGPGLVRRLLEPPR